MCDLQEAREMSWCAANATVNETSETTGLQQILYKANYNSHVPDGVKRESHKDVIITSGLVVSCVLLAYQLGLGVKRGNVFTLVFVSILSMLQSLRHLLFSSAQTLSVDGFLEMVGLALSIASFPLLYRAREQLSKNRFLFFGIATRNKQLLDHYERMFAFTLMDWQVSLTFCVQCAIISQNFWIRSAIICLSVCDVFSLYLAYLYVRYERKIILVAIAAKSFALVVWIVLVAYYYHCFADYRASAMYIRSLIASSSYLMIDRLDAVRYVGGHCDLLSSISTADEAVFFLILILLAVVLRLLSCNHALMLTLHFNEGSEGGIIKSLFFDVVAAREVRRRVEAKDFDANDA
jgi:hypothetical protein